MNKNNITCIPAYVLDPSYKMTHILVAKIADGVYQFRQCFTSKGGAINKFKKASERWPDVEFKLIPINEIN